MTVVNVQQKKPLVTATVPQHKLLLYTILDKKDIKR